MLYFQVKKIWIFVHEIDFVLLSAGSSVESAQRGETPTVSHSQEGSLRRWNQTKEQRGRDHSKFYILRIGCLGSVGC
jgi:hypothetical protein